MIALLVEDLAPLRAMTADFLREHGWQVDAEADGESGLWRATSERYDVIILDVVLPDVSGLAVLSRLRSGGDDTPVILLTARDGVADRVHGLNAGADDYLVKPFDPAELLARCMALSRRRNGQPSSVLKVRSLAIDTAARRVMRDGSEISLPPREYALLELLARRAGCVVSRGEIERHLYTEDDGPMSNAVDARVCALRRLVDRPGESSLVITKRGMGYLIDAG